LIPGVTYNPKIETCSGANCTTELLSFTTPATGSCVLSNNPISTTAPYAGRCGSYTLPVDANVGDQVQVWLSHTVEFNDNTVHPLVQDSNAEMMVLTVENHPNIGNSITFSYDECEKNVYLAYRYFTDDKSSPLFNVSLVTSSTANNIAWYAVCDCNGNSNTPSVAFIIDDCYLTDIVYNYLEVGEKLQHKEFDVPSSGAEQLLHSEIHGITNANYTYDLKHATNAEKVDFREKETNPWVSLDLTAVPCITTNNSPPTGNQNALSSETKLERNNDLRLYPNPTQDYLNVEIAAVADLQLIGIDGKSHDLRDLKETSYGYRFSTSHLVPGLYLIRTIDEVGKVQTGKFLVQE
jgi:hypothetical protein